MNKYQLTLWTDDMIFTRGAIASQLDRFSRQWRKTFIDVGADVAEVYLPAIKSHQRMLKQIDEALTSLV